MRRAPMRRQRGVAAVDFGLSAVLLLVALLGSVEVGRALWTWNAAVEAMRVGARLAATCAQDAAGIKKQMQKRLPALTDSQITLTYTNPGGLPNCTFANCRLVTVSLTNASHQLLLLPATLTVDLPAFTTSLPREIMDSATHPECS